MERRNFVRNLGLTALGISSFPSLAFNLPSNRTNYLIAGWVTTAITIAKIAISASEMFKGTSSNGISDIQILMLENISKQLKVVQDGITTIIEDLAEIKSLIGELPQKVVEELLQKKLQGNITTFDELMKTYANYGENKEKFLQEHSDEVKSLTDKIRENRSVLMDYDNYLNIPLLATALYMEYNCMQLISEQKERILPVIEKYKSYFQSLLYNTDSANLELIIQDIRKKRNEIISQANETHFFEASVNHYMSGFYRIRTGFYKFSSVPDFVFENNEIEDLLKLGLISNNERIHEVDVEIKNRYYARVGGSGTDWNPNRQPGVPGLLDWKPASSFINYEDLKKNIETNKIELQDSIKLETLKLYTAVSCFHSGNRALNFCNSF